MEKMLMTQALDERDFLAKKIADKIARASFVDDIRHNAETACSSRMFRQDFSRDAKSSYQQIQDLIDRYERLDAAIVASNANTIIHTSVGDFSVAAAISLRARLRGQGKQDTDFEAMLLRKMSNELKKALEYAERKNQDLQTAAETMQTAILGKDSRTKDDSPLSVVDAYIRENTTELLDPLEVQKKAIDLKEKSDRLLSELETAIKVSNATTMIEF